ncbi:MAG: LPXTG cell wall anchor domain-containing protein [Methanobacteriota archaeon]|nr:MAG: LPXTG cell wall anchor domain-containing protein [Euryarchaeota archaeon]
MPPLGETDLGFLIGGVVVLFLIGLVVYRRRIRR